MNELQKIRQGGPSAGSQAKKNDGRVPRVATAGHPYRTKIPNKGKIGRGAPLRAPRRGEIVWEYYRRKTIRLNRKVYEEVNQPFSITVCTWSRILLSDEMQELIFRSAMEGDLNKKSDLMAVCVMPDHIHLLLSPIRENLIDLIGRWKSYTTHLIKLQGGIGRLWQRSFYDHGLRRDEDLLKVAEYIVSNPVRKGIVKEWESYLYAWHKWVQHGQQGWPRRATPTQ